MSEYRRMAHRMMKAIWSSTAILLGMASFSHGQTTPPYFGNPAAMPDNSTAAAPAEPPEKEGGTSFFGLGKLFAFTPSITTAQSTEQLTEQPRTEPHPATSGSGREPAPQQSWPPEQKSVGQLTATNNVAVPANAPTTHSEELLHDIAYGSDGTGPNRMFVQLDLLTWAINRPDTTAIGDTASEGIVNVSGNSYFRSNSLDNGFISSNWSLGGRVDFGRVDGRHGWSGSVLFYRHQDQLDANGVWFVPSDPDGLLQGYQDSNNDGFDDDVNGNNIYGRNGQDLGTPDPANPGSFLAPFDGTPDQTAPIDPGDLVRWLVTFSTLTTTNTVELTGVELMDVYRPNGWGATTLDWLWGVRYLEFREKFGVVATGGTLDSSHWNVDSSNDILGPQIGARLAVNREWFRFTAEGRFLAGLNFQNDRLNGGIAANATTGGVNKPIALEASSFNALRTNTEFSPVGEWRMEASYYANSWLAFRVGYTGMVIGGASRASPKVAYALPTFGLTDAGSNETILTNGLNIGVEINR